MSQQAADFIQSYFQLQLTIPQVGLALHFYSLFAGTEKQFLLGGVGAVDYDVLFGEVAAPGRGVFVTQVQRDAEGDLVAPH